MSVTLFWLGIAWLAYLTVGTIVGIWYVPRHGVEFDGVKPGFIALCAATLLAAAVARYLGY